MTPDHDAAPTTRNRRSTDCSHGHVASRRRVLQVGAAGAVVALAGCLGGDGGGEAPDPVDVDGSWECDVCGMVISQHPGPSAEIFYADERPNDHDNPARFCSTWEAFSFDFEREDWDRQAFYVTDYSGVDYEVDASGAQPSISRHLEASSFVDAETVTFVVGSEVVGAMGRDMIGFAAAADAESFQSEYGGDLATFDDVTPSMIAALGM